MANVPVGGGKAAAIAVGYPLACLLCWGVVAWRGIIGFYATSALLWDGAVTLTLAAHWFMRHSTSRTCGRRSPLYYLNGPIMAVVVWWPLLMHCAGSVDIVADLRRVMWLSAQSGSPIQDDSIEGSRDAQAVQACFVCLLAMFVHQTLVVWSILSGAQVRMAYRLACV